MRNKRFVHRWTQTLLWSGNLGFGLLATATPRRVAAMTGETEDQVRTIAARDLKAGLALLSAREPLLPLLAGLRSDAAEAAGWLRRKPMLAAVPILWCALAVVAILTRE